MGAWGTALYSDDTASDVRDLCNEVYGLVGMDEAKNIIWNEYRDVIESDLVDNDYAVFWYALADWQWNHGILDDEVKRKALSLLENHTGIDEWIEAGNPKDVEKRMLVLDRLYEKISAPQPPRKLPKPRLLKPKHKPGEMIVFRACTQDRDPENYLWNIEYCTEDIYAAPELEGAPSVLTPPYDAHGKYMALLCVGSEKVPRSQYVEGYEDEYSVYVFYDYLSDTLPTAEELLQCGFLPRYIRYAKEIGSGIEQHGWAYTFYLYSCSFRNDKNAPAEIVSKYFCPSEQDRFWGLLRQKDYLEEVDLQMNLQEAFCDFFETKAQLSSVGHTVDSLLDVNQSNPELKSLEALERLFQLQAQRDTEEFMRKMKEKGLD